MEKSNKKSHLLKKESTEYFVCDRCEINSTTEDRMCPCPRGGCEAQVKGKLIKTTILILK